MNMNAVADAVLPVVAAIHSRTYRTKPPQSPAWPYVICTLDSSIENGPSSDIYLNVDVIEDPNVSVRAMETLADSIQNALDDKVLINSTLNIHLVIEQRQYVSNDDLIANQMINMRFVVRSYFK